MKYANKDVAIHYFTNPAMENEPLGKIVDGVMHQVAREVPSVIFTDTSGNTKHLYVGGSQMGSISLEGVTKILDDIIHYNQNIKNG